MFRVDVRKILQTGIMPIINKAIAHKDASIGMFEAGMTNPPVEAFEKVLLA